MTRGKLAKVIGQRKPPSSVGAEPSPAPASEREVRPFALRALSVAHRVLHRASGGRIGSLDPGAQAPKGRALRMITEVHRRLYIWSDGRLGANAGGLPTLLLTTRGRRSGAPRTVPLPFFVEAEGYVVVASFAGNPKHPAWYTNLLAEPRVQVQIGSRRFAATASPARGEARAALFARVTRVAPMYADYQRQTEREIPLVLLSEDQRAESL